MQNIIPLTRSVSYVNVPEALCECGAWVPAYRDEMGNHSRPYGSVRTEGDTHSGTWVCRHAGRKLTLDGAIARDDVLSPQERRVAYAVHSALVEGTSVRFPWESHNAE